MSRFVVAFAAFAMIASYVTPSYALKPLAEAFAEQYCGTGASEALKAKVADAKCNVCHVGTQKKNRNPYGVALHDALKDAKFSIPDLKKSPKDAKLIAAAKEVMKKLEDKKPKGAGADAKTFGQRIKAGELPGAE